MVLLDTGTPGTSREIFNEDADDGTRTRNPSITNQSALAIELYSYTAQKLLLGRSRAENFSTGTKSPCVQ